MTYTCPACETTGSNKNFSYLGNQQMICNFCGITLQTALECPNGHIVIAKRELLDKLIPGLAIVKLFTGVTKAICPICRFKGEYPKDFRFVLSYDRKLTFAKPN